MATGTDRARLAEPEETGELGEILARCAAENKTVELGGGFTKHAMGGLVWPADVIVSTRRLARVADYEPRDLTISVEAGLRFGVLQALLRENNQMLPLDPPLAESATVGGVVAANCNGPRRRLYGSVRDVIIGMTFVTLEGKPVRSGGMVVKNVAGLDMAKLLVGSFGTLAAIARVNFKLFPLPPRQKTFVLSFDSLEAALKARDGILRSVLQPAAIDLVNPALARRLPADLPEAFLLLIEAGGIEAAMARYERELKNVARDAGDASVLALEDEPAELLWLVVRDFPALAPVDGHPGEPVAILRLSTTLARVGECIALAADRPALSRAGSGVTYISCPAASLDLASRARAAGLYAVIESSSAADKNKLELWADPGPELEVMSRIKQTLDPQGLLNRGRLYNRL